MGKLLWATAQVVALGAGIVGWAINFWAIISMLWNQPMSELGWEFAARLLASGSLWIGALFGYFA